MPVGIVQIFVVIGGGGLVGAAARSRGRSFVPWAAISTVLSAIVYVLMTTVAAGSVGFASSGVAGVFALLVAPAVPHLILGALVKAAGHHTSRNRWNVTPLGTGEPSTLQLSGDHVLLGTDRGAATRIPLFLVESVRPDCECIRLAWTEGDESREAVLQIVLDGAEWETRAALAETAAQTIEAARVRGSSLPRARAVDREQDARG